MTVDEAKAIAATYRARTGQPSGHELVRYFAARVVLESAGIETMSPAQRDFARRSSQHRPQPESQE